MKEIHIIVPDYLYHAWKEYVAQFKNSREALANIPYIKQKLQGKLIIEEKVKR